MTDIERIENIIKSLEIKLDQLPVKILSDVKKLIDLHTHKMNGQVIWEIPNEVRRALEEKRKSNNKTSNGEQKFNEQVMASDECVITLTKQE